MGPSPNELGNDDCVAHGGEAILRLEKVLQGDHLGGKLTEAACLCLVDASQASLWSVMVAPCRQTFSPATY